MNELKIESLRAAIEANRQATRAEAADLWPDDDRWFTCQCGAEHCDADEQTFCRFCGRTGKFVPSPPNEADDTEAETILRDDWNSWGGR